MSKFGRVVLSEIEDETINIACTQCAFRRVLKKDRLIDRFKNVALHDLLANLASGCEKSQGVGISAECGAYFVELAGRKNWPGSK